MQINSIQLKQLIEASLFVLGKPLSVKMLKETVLADFSVSRDKIKAALEELQQDYQERGVQLVKVAGGYRFQTLEVLSPFLQPLWQEKAPKYSRATLETLAVIAYRQPVTRGDIEQVRGVAISSHIIKSLSDRHWIKVVGHKEVPGRPALYATTLEFLAYFGLDTLADLPALTDTESLQAVFSGLKVTPEQSEEQDTNE
ncbi:SMC-Scp complex subunit ScpB [Shewanella oneidensis MR-1]|uniref:Segregation and condensation protein ScpB n=1 Tax=Shewanella oneidensis (strain ATCC 700550 / JCM 31522 / CIP 106686 / LMG 19005 / NCIMB 14063 / MR-1) TaxID=211586 RepID=Q7ZAJ6_SHEON|nr:MULTISPECIES: SMC-Scp complex subunit ScpB [Shewanella]AAN56026.1 segregation and condensation protein ScpB [Shewanella oneidensis MR-1]MDX5999537.1 SMC-Scp complex subunit ScpB [Shewanella oneidensis]MEE1979236.1 SMC-Scp complex subunit ScpB [Shewanella xiamenensis]MEE2027402.1 Segregation and condensation protein B [Shewanella oneidensis]QKG97468.1 SMC-Scp complex subunit ScpB [Shewanella oneidensis MR-1]